MSSSLKPTKSILTALLSTQYQHNDQPPSVLNTPPDQSDPLSPTMNDVDNSQSLSPIIDYQGFFPITVSSSPVKEKMDYWIPQLRLFKSDKCILTSHQWLNDNIISATQCLLEKQTAGKIYGWQSTQFSKRKGLFHQVPAGSPFIQLLHVDNNHWVATSDLNVHGKGSLKDTICIYDSSHRSNITLESKKMMCSLLRSRSNSLRFDLINIQEQPNAYDCGLCAIASATELAHYSDPAKCCWDFLKMREHLINCLEEGHVSRFPLVGQRKVRLGTRIRHSIVEDIFCICGMPNEKSRRMIQCDDCSKWYHDDCLSIDIEKFSHKKWFCQECKAILEELGT